VGARAAAMAPRRRRVERALAAALVLASLVRPASTLRSVACVGDSITYGRSGGLASDGRDSYPHALHALLGWRSWDVGNFGQGGSTAQDVDGNGYRTAHDDDYEAALAMNADVYVVQLGTNDAKVENWNATSFAASLEGLARSFAALPRGPRVVVGVPPPLVKGNHRYWGPAAASPINDGTLRAAIYAVAARNGFGVADNYDGFGGYESALENEGLYVDQIHPSRDGYAIIAATVYAALYNETWTYAPTYGPTAEPSAEPSASFPPSTAPPTILATGRPSASWAPTGRPSTDAPSYAPTRYGPSRAPSPSPTYAPTEPTEVGPRAPTAAASSPPATSPPSSEAPSYAPSTYAPTSASPTSARPTSAVPAPAPTSAAPSAAPAPAPSSRRPTPAPSSAHPSARPSAAPSPRPTAASPASPAPSSAAPSSPWPTAAPSAGPSRRPAPRPTSEPSRAPSTARPTRPPTARPTRPPTTRSPSFRPTRPPTTRPPTTPAPTTPAPTSRPPTTRPPTTPLLVTFGECVLRGVAAADFGATARATFAEATAAVLGVPAAGVAVVAVVDGVAPTAGRRRAIRRLDGAAPTVTVAFRVRSAADAASVGAALAAAVDDGSFSWMLGLAGVSASRVTMLVEDGGPSPPSSSSSSPWRNSPLAPLELGLAVAALALLAAGACREARVRRSNRRDAVECKGSFDDAALEAVLSAVPDALEDGLFPSPPASPPPAESFDALENLLGKLEEAKSTASTPIHGDRKAPLPTSQSCPAILPAVVRADPHVAVASPAVIRRIQLGGYPLPPKRRLDLAAAPPPRFESHRGPHADGPARDAAAASSPVVVAYAGGPARDPDPPPPPPPPAVVAPSREPAPPPRSPSPAPARAATPGSRTIEFDVDEEADAATREIQFVVRTSLSFEAEDCGELERSASGGSLNSLAEPSFFPFSRASHDVDDEDLSYGTDDDGSAGGGAPSARPCRTPEPAPPSTASSAGTWALSLLGAAPLGGSSFVRRPPEAPRTPPRTPSPVLPVVVCSPRRDDPGLVPVVDCSPAGKREASFWAGTPGDGSSSDDGGYDDDGDATIMESISAAIACGRNSAVRSPAARSPRPPGSPRSPHAENLSVITAALAL